MYDFIEYWIYESLFKKLGKVFFTEFYKAKLEKGQFSLVFHETFHRISSGTDCEC